MQATGARSVLAGALTCLAGVALTTMAKSGLDGVVGWTALAAFGVAALAARTSVRRAR